MTTQPTLFDTFTVHCFACPYAVTGTSPVGLHDLMEAHYAAEHAALIARMVAW